MEGIALLSEKWQRLITMRFQKQRENGRVQVVASSSFFVPKPFTPFQWATMCTKEGIFKKSVSGEGDKFRQMLNYKSLKYNYHGGRSDRVRGYAGPW